MSIKSRIIRGVLKWLWVRYPCQMKDIVIPPNAHIHLNPRPKREAEAERLESLARVNAAMDTRAKP